jgi:hypothetical protein
VIHQTNASRCFFAVLAVVNSFFKDQCAWCDRTPPCLVASDCYGTAAEGMRARMTSDFRASPGALRLRS